MKKKLTVILAMAVSIPSYAAGQSQHEPAPQQKPQKVYHIGADVKAPRVITSVQPIVDEQLTKQLNTERKSEKTGSTTLRIVVGEDGTVRTARVLQSFTRALDAKAIDAVRQWKFEPATRKGVPVAVELEVEVDFHLYN